MFKIVESGGIPHIAPNTRNVIVHMNSNIIGKWYGIIRPISR